MSKYSNALRSKDGWKSKAIERGETVRKLTKENKRIKDERERYKLLAKHTKKELDAKNKMYTPCRIKDKSSLVLITLELFLVARIGFRAVSRVLDILKEHLGIPKPPSHQTVINWLIRLSIVKIRYCGYVEPTFIPKASFTNGFIWMIDISIGLGAGKILTVLALDLAHHKNSSKAPQLKDVNCIGVAVAPSWNGEGIAHFLKKLISILGRPSAYLKDGGTDLDKAIRVLGEDKLSSPCIDDISHVFANLLKHEYKEHPMFDIFLSACGKVSKKMKQTILACLAPPKTSIKARFMNFHKLVSWAKKVLGHSKPGRAMNNSIQAKLRGCLDDLPECKAFIERFHRDAQSLLEIQKILKNDGLNKKTYKCCLNELKVIPESSSIHKGVIRWFDKQLKLAKDLQVSNSGLLITSDPIESLFAIGKCHGTGEIKDANRIAMRLPAYCGSFNIEDAKRVIDITVHEQKSLETITITKQRRQILENPEALETLANDENCSAFELIPEVKKWGEKERNADNVCIIPNIHELGQSRKSEDDTQVNYVEMSNKAANYG